MSKKDTYLKLIIYTVTLVMLYGYTMVEGSGYLILNTGAGQNIESKEDNENAAGNNVNDSLKYEQNRDTKKIAITFDDGPSGEYTEKLLDALKERNVKATFFVLGEKAEENEELILRMKNEGHLIGNHTYSHIRLTAVGDEEAMEEIAKTNDIIREITGDETEYIRPPFGSYEKEHIRAENMIVVLWDIDPKDWVTYDADKVAEDVINKAEDGQIILMHDIFDTSVDAAIKIIDTLIAEGYQFVTVEEILLD
ncbi:MAG: polysaccharide deacetylase family protein [Lachnospiraceae bacterium]|nr:polysaccharide deacetylase family protein [Lachnospiraceae bacterium]